MVPVVTFRELRRKEIFRGDDSFLMLNLELWKANIVTAVMLYFVEKMSFMIRLLTLEITMVPENVHSAMVVLYAFFNILYNL